MKFLAAGNKKEISFACQLKDGKKFMAVTDEGVARVDGAFVRIKQRVTRNPRASLIDLRPSGLILVDKLGCPAEWTVWPMRLDAWPAFGFA